MNKADLVKEAVRKTGLTRRKVARGVDATLAVIKRELSKENKIRISGLGSLEFRPKRSGFLPGAGTPPRPVPPGKSVKLRATRKALADLNSEPLAVRTGSGSDLAFGSSTITGGKMEKNKDTDAGTGGAAVGLDIGTSRLVLASGSTDSVKTSAELNAFITVPYSKITENILKQNKVTYQLNGNHQLQIFGNQAARFANTFNTELRRPMLNGTLNPGEEYSLPVMQAIIQQLVKKSKHGESLRFSVPGPLRDAGSSDLVYHEAMLKNLLDGMGYHAKAVNEGLAVVFSELESENFSGLGISCGGGMCNVCFAFMSIPVTSFSIAKAGDYIDRSVASVTNESMTHVRTIKEDGLDLSRPPKNKWESALHVYYDDVILSLVEATRAALAESKNLPRVDTPISIVISGGTSKPKGFLDKFRVAVERDGFPLSISEIRMAGDPLTSTARGCLIAALYDA